MHSKHIRPGRRMHFLKPMALAICCSRPATSVPSGFRMSPSASNQSSPRRLAADSWQPLDIVVAVLWLGIPAGVLLGRTILLHGVHELSVKLSRSTQYLVGLDALVVILILSVAVLSGTVAIQRHNTRRQFVISALFVGVFVVSVYVAFCLVPAITTIHRLG